METTFSIAFILVMLKELFFVIVFPVLVIVALVIGVSVLYQYIKYGNKVFTCFKMNNTSDCRNQMLWLTLDKILWYKKILKLSYLSSNCVMIDKNGISLFNLFMYLGDINGSGTDKKVIVSVGSDSNTSVPNPVLDINRDEKIIKEMLPNVDIKKYIVVVEGERFNVTDLDDVKVLKFNTLLYNLHDGKKYSKEEIRIFLKLLLNKEKMTKDVNKG